jgi:hypothetical protein
MTILIGPRRKWRYLDQWKNNRMQNELLTGAADPRIYSVWLIALLLVAFGFRHAKDLIAFVLDKLYQTFIQQNPLI